MPLLTLACKRLRPKAHMSQNQVSNMVVIIPPTQRFVNLTAVAPPSLSPELLKQRGRMVRSRFLIQWAANSMWLNPCLFCQYNSSANRDSEEKEQCL